MTTVVRTQRRTVVAPTGAAETVVRNSGGGAQGIPGPPGLANSAFATRNDMAAYAPGGGIHVGDNFYLSEAGREGAFVVDLASSWTAAITADAAQKGLFVPSTFDATKVYRRVLNGTVNAAWFGFAAANSAATNTTAGQAAIDLLAALGGGTLRFPEGVFSHSGLTFKNKVQYRGGGRDTGSANGTVLLYTGTGDGVQINNQINSSTAANISVEGITFKNANRNAGKGCFADTGSTDLKFRHCAFIGSDRGLILDQSELVDVIECDFEGVASQTTLAWLLNGADRTVSAAAQFTNRIKFEGCQFNGQTGTVLIADDGGNAHSFTDNNYNGGLSHIRAASVIGLKISGGEFESASGPSIRFDSTSLAGTGVGSCGSVYIGDGAEIVPGGSGQYCILAQSLGSVTLNTVYLGNTSAAKFGGTGNVSAIYAINCFNGGGGATFDGRATNHWEVGDNGTLFAVRTNMPIQFNGVQVVAARQTGTPADATDLATALTLLNSIKAKLITHGLIS